METKPYSHYKESGIEWIGEIPKHWLLSKLDNYSKITPGYPFNSDYFNIEGIPLIRIRDLKNKKTTVYWNEKVPLNTIINNGDILVGMDGDFDVVIWKGLTSLLNQRIFKIESLNELNNKFLGFFLQYPITVINQKTMSTTVKHLTIKDSKNIMFYLPLVEEQELIVKYLDTKTTKIEQTITKYKKLITLLKEKRATLINQTVTKGLKPDIPMKESGIGWIGKIPEEWKINKIKNLCYVKGRIGWHGLTSEEYSEEGAYLVTGTDFKKGKINWETCHHISYERYKEDPYIHLKVNDLLITKDGTIGKLALVKNLLNKSTLNSGIFLVRPLNNNEFVNEYLYWILSSDIFSRFYDYIKTGATISHLYQETFERFFFPYPSIDEQLKICKYLDIKTYKIDKTIEKIEKNIELLEEYKESLIHHVVTGKIDVRGVEV